MDNFKRKEPNELRVLVPENLAIDSLLEVKPPTEIIHFNREDLLFYLSLVCAGNEMASSLKTKDGYVPLFSNMLNSIGRDYRKYFEWLENNRVIEILPKEITYDSLLFEKYPELKGEGKFILCRLRPEYKGKSKTIILKGRGLLAKLKGLCWERASQNIPSYFQMADKVKGKK